MPDNDSRVLHSGLELPVIPGDQMRTIAYGIRANVEREAHQAIFEFRNVDPFGDIDTIDSRTIEFGVLEWGEWFAHLATLPPQGLHTALFKRLWPDLMARHGIPATMEESLLIFRYHWIVEDLIEAWPGDIDVTVYLTVVIRLLIENGKLVVKVDDIMEGDLIARAELLDIPFYKTPSLRLGKVVAEVETSIWPEVVKALPFMPPGSTLQSLYFNGDFDLCIGFG